MEVYKISKRGRTKAIRRYVKSKLGEAKGIVKTCNVIKVILRALAVILAVGTVVYVFAAGEPLDLLFLVLTFGIPYGLSFIPAMVCKASIGIDYRFRRKETVELNDGGFVYSCRDTRTGFRDRVFKYTVDFNKVDKIEYDENSRLLEIFGDVTVETYAENKLIESGTYGMFDFLNCFDIDMYRLIQEKMTKGYQ